jgi:hypothetical protein
MDNNDRYFQYTANFPLDTDKERELDEEFKNQPGFAYISNMINMEIKRRRSAKHIITLEGVRKFQEAFSILYNFAREFYGEIKVIVDFKAYECQLLLELNAFDCDSPILKHHLIRLIRSASTFSVTEKLNNRFAIEIEIDLFKEIEF